MTATAAASSAPAAPTLYDRIGGEDGVRRFTRRFYAIMDSEPEARACRDIHPKSLDESEQKLFEYLSGWLGGPQLFVARHGAPMLRARHQGAAIGQKEMRGWLLCFRWSLVDTVPDAEVRAAVLPQIEMLARAMQNQG